MKKVYFIVFLLVFSSDLLSQFKTSCNSDFVKNNLKGYIFIDSDNEVSEESPALACLLSVCLPGLGQIYNGEIVKGLLFTTGVVIGSGILVARGVISNINPQQVNLYFTQE